MSTALHAAFRLRWRSSHWHGGNGCQQKQKKSIDQRAPQIGYEGIKSLRSLAMKNYLVTGGLLSLVESYNNIGYPTTSHGIWRFIPHRGKLSGINPIFHGWLLDKYTYFILPKGNLKQNKTLKNLAMEYGNLSNGHQPIRT